MNHHQQTSQSLAVADYAALSNEELLSSLIGVRETRRLYRGSLATLFRDASVVGKCAVARELVKRWLGEEMRSSSALTSPAAVRDYLRIAMRDREHEVFFCLWLDAQHRVINAQELFRGTLTQTSVYPREVVKAALRVNAAAVIFAHNHPSGITQPSHSDEHLTRNLKEALALIEVRVLDHFIVAGTNILSFAERGLI